MPPSRPPVEDPTTRFGNRVADYVAARPRYPAEAVDFVLRAGGVPAGGTVVDVGAGTGIFSRLLIQRALRTIAVEPNREMLSAAVRASGDHERFQAVVAKAEATGLAAGSADLVTAAQAFHWFDAAAFAAECRRILRPKACVALLWNARRGAGDPFSERYERLLEAQPTYASVNHRGVAQESLNAFFGGRMATASFAHTQRLDWTGLLARAMSSSYVPARGSDAHARFVEALRAIHHDTADAQGRVGVVYDTNVYVGRPA